MSGTILDRLEARLAAKPAVIHIETLFDDLLEARDEVKMLTERVRGLVAASDRIAVKAETEVKTVGVAVAHIAPDTVAHVHTLLNDAKERLSVNALGTVASHIENAIKLLESKF